MASIPPTSAPNAQLAGIVSSVPMPRANNATLADGTPATIAADGSNVRIGGETGHGFSIVAPGTPHNAAAATGGGAIVVGGAGTTPAAGAQPAPPGTAADGTPTTPATATPATTAATPATDAPAAAAEAGPHDLSGFGRQDKNAVMRASVDGASFSFPSFNASARSVKAPAITWGPGWTRVQKDGMYYMQHSNGTKAIPAVEYRITPKPADKVQTIKVANGWGKKFPDGTVLVFDRNEGPYRLDPSGRKHKVSLGTHTFGGVKVRVFEAAVVRTLESNGAVTVFDSRGNHGAGTSRGRLAGAAATGGGGVQQLTGGGVVQQGGGGSSGADDAKLAQHVQHLTGVARDLLQQVQGGRLDPVALQALQAQLSTLPSGILQAAGGAGTMTSDGTLPPTPGSTVAGTNGGGDASPTPGRDAHADAVKSLAAGTKAKLDVAAPQDLVGKQARFGQLPAELQSAVAKAFGSSQGSAALEADTLVSFSAGGEVSLVEGGRVFVKHVPQVRGAGPGEDMALTVRPGRQPGTAGASASGGGSAARPVRPGSSNGSHGSHGHSHGTGSSSGSGAAGGGSAAGSRNVRVFGPGAAVKAPALRGIEGSFTWRSLPAAARTAIVEWLRANPGHPAGAAFRAPRGGGWTFDPAAQIVIAGGTATFLDGLSLVRSTRPAISGGGGTGPTTTPIGHDAAHPPASGGRPSGGGSSRPPVSGGGGVGTVAPGTAPPIPVVNDPGETPGGGRGGAVHRH